MPSSKFLVWCVAVVVTHSLGTSLSLNLSLHPGTLPVSPPFKHAAPSSCSEEQLLSS